MTTRSDDQAYMQRAFAEARKGYDEGGVPVGAVLVANGRIIGAGHNKRVQAGNPIAHGEMDCLQNAGRRPRYDDTMLYTTLSPCMMCAGTIVQFGIKRVVVGENANFGGNEEFLRQRGIEVVLLDDAACKDLMGKFIREKPELWSEDIAGEDTRTT
jgi:cytosine/creatinine deaminase